MWLEVAATSIKNISVSVCAGIASLSIGSYYLTLLEAKQQVRTEGILMQHLPQSPNVGCYTK